MSAASSLSDRVLRVCLVLLFFVFSRAYEEKDADLVADNVLAIQMQEAGLCCPCTSESSVVGGRISRDICCACAPKLGQKKIPLAPLPRGSNAFSNVDVDPSVKSCELIVGDLLSSRPSCVSYKKSRVDCFYVNAETQTVFQKTLLNGEPQESEDTEGKVRDEVVALAVSSSKFTLVALNQSNYVISRMVKGSKWTDWAAVLDTVALEVPAAFMRPSGGVTCFYRTLQNSLSYVDRSRYGIWTGPKALHMDSMASAPSCTTRGDDDAEECFVLAANNSVAHQQWLYGGEWQMNTGLGGLGKGRISVTSPNIDRLDVFVLGDSNQLMHRVFTGENWDDWEDLGGSFVSAPECVSVGEEAVHCFLIGVDRTLMHKYFDGESWSEWASSTYAHIETPSCVVPSDTTIICYTRGYTGHMVEIVYSV